MKTKTIATATPRRPSRLPVLQSTSVLSVALFFAACSSSDSGLGDQKKDSSLDRQADGVNKDLGPDNATDTPAGCSNGNQFYTLGETFTLPGSCPIVCRCLATGLSCNTCVPDGGVTDTRPIDAPPGVTCPYGGKNYLPGDTVPTGVAPCTASCVCLASGSLGFCTGGCPEDGGHDLPADRPDAPVDYPNDLPVEHPIDLGVDHISVDTVCITGAPCTLGDGGSGLCSAGICKACAGPQDDNACANVYGSNHLCVGGQCIAGTCHDSSACTGSKVCDTTYTCHNCASDLQCQNDATYGRGTICLSNGQCASGTCHTSSDCQGKKLCDGSVHTCASCTTDSQCQADSVYGANSICVSSQCVAGTCSTTADCKSEGRLCSTGKCAECTSDTQCRGDSAYGSGTICVSGQCVSGTCNNSSQCPSGRICNTTSHACVACANDNQCKTDTNYGTHTLCLSGACTTGDCHDISSDCSAGRICGSTVPHACGDCSSDTQCRQDARYQTGYICVGNLCVQGDCHDTSNECTSSKAGLVCGASTPHTCSACSDDDQCQNDAKYGTTTICNRASGTSSGQCVSYACSNNNHACTANPADFCCSNKCVAGNCCADADCAANPAYGSNFFCRQNTCTHCDAVSGTNYLVDPVNGDDSMATGSGLAAGVATVSCSFRTITRALLAIGTSPAAGTTITVVGASGSTTSLYTVRPAGATAAPETLPISVPANVTITTKTGPIKLTLPGSKVGFSLIGDQANLLPVAAALLTIDGASHASASGITVAAGTGTSKIANLTITGTGDDGIQVTSGTLQIGAGVRVTDAGTTTSGQNGLLISGGTVNITVAASETPTLFDANSQSGIAVSGSGVLNISGANSGSSHSVAVQNNQAANLSFRPDTTAAQSSLDGLYSYGAGQGGDGLYILAGRKIKVRNSIFQANTGSGIHIAASGSLDLSTVDLGSTTTTLGRNVLQTATGSNPNAGAGLCVDLAGTGSGTLRAAGNQFAGRDCATSTAAIRTATTCTTATDLGIVTGTTATVDTSTCTH